MSDFMFVQFEFPWALGPADGRYVLRGPAGLPSHVLVLKTLGASERRGRLRRPKAKDATPEPDPTPVPTTRATLVHADPLAGDQKWSPPEDPDAEVDDAVGVLNTVLHAHRTAAMDPHVREVGRDQALVVRLGVGDGEQVADGKWSQAIELPAPTPSRRSFARAGALRPQERLAAILSGRDVALAAEELTLRARLDLEGGRGREAALQLRVALEAALAELVPWSDRSDIGTRITELREARGEVGAAANAALQGGLDEPTTATVERIVGRIESALRARVAPGLD
jgi:hypothetical protein